MLPPRAATYPGPARAWPGSSATEVTAPPSPAGCPVTVRPVAHHRFPSPALQRPAGTGLLPPHCTVVQ
eukprot:3991508-Pleurochrysis_carterae.AAC.1